MFNDVIFGVVVGNIEVVEAIEEVMLYEADDHHELLSSRMHSAVVNSPIVQKDVQLARNPF